MDPGEFEASLVNTASSKTACATQTNPLSEQQQQQNKTTTETEQKTKTTTRKLPGFKPPGLSLSGFYGRAGSL